ncbi:NAD-dependent epimerase/dehydratase family protein [Catenuloplanes atrovinosus]|uniref:Nucleoside-diphosphate-sugar epimerase n=1 Tax=Catenuloplanes atrovinosus TaxID=137266 RepID=A0AAE3YJT2_9ACTN|nr:NAD-dependent epimerase/dehydratase family protein [Catenuloplanes atrovinosus]MDR7273812.1 nucleoside-diphosphate-sugar epimerase [Catenuloplanes atrovinosus]
MRLLVLGGTEFVGRAVVEAAVARGWRVTVLNRGRHTVTQAGVVSLRGDRTAPDGLAALSGRSFDAVVDTWSWAPSAVTASASLLSSVAGSYAYVSSRSVYAWPAPRGAAEDAPLVPPSDDLADYAGIKRAGELAAIEHFGDRALLVRAGLILGPQENVGRLPWWLTRIARGGDVLAPGPASLPLQYVDVRDLAEWTLDALAAGLGGAYNLVSPPGHATMSSLLAACADATGASAALRWADPEPILDAGVEPWTDLPIWLPPGETHDAMHTSDVSRALATGLRCRPVAETVADTWAWLRSIGGVAPQRDDRPPLGLDPDTEAALLKRLT